MIYDDLPITLMVVSQFAARLTEGNWSLRFSEFRCRHWTVCRCHSWRSLWPDELELSLHVRHCLQLFTTAGPYVCKRTSRHNAWVLESFTDPHHSPALSAIQTLPRSSKPVFFWPSNSRGLPRSADPLEIVYNHILEWKHMDTNSFQKSWFVRYPENVFLVLRFSWNPLGIQCAPKIVIHGSEIPISNHGPHGFPWFFASLSVSFHSKTRLGIF